MRLISVIAAFTLATLLACGSGSSTIYTLSTGTYTLSSTSAAIRSSPHVGFSRAIFRMSSRRFRGTRGLPRDLDFHRQSS